MAEPSLSEIVNMTVDPERGTGTPAVVFDSKPLIAQLNQSAQYKAESDWRKYNLFLGNLKEVYKDLGEIAKMPVMTQDQPHLKEQMAGILKEVSEDPKGFFGGGPKYQDVLGKISKLQSDATESKQNAMYDFAHRQYFYRNPELDTPENRQVIDGYGSQKLGTRQPYLMKLPGYIDFTKLWDPANEASKKKEGDVSSDGRYITTTDQTAYDPDAYMRTSEALYSQFSDKANDMFNRLPDFAKKMYAGSQDPAKQWFLDSMAAGRKQGESDKKMVGDPTYLQKEKMAQDQNQFNREMGYKWTALNKGGKEADDAKNQIGELTNRTLGTLFSKDSNSGLAYLQNMYGDNSEIEISETSPGTARGVENTVKTKVLAKEVVSSIYDAGTNTVEVSIRDNKSKEVSKKKITVNDALVDMGRMFGPKYNPETVTSIATEYRTKNKLGGVQPDMGKVQSYFGINTTQAPVSDNGWKPVTDPKVLEQLNK